MAVRPLEEDFQRLGLSQDEIRASLHNMGRPLGEMAEADLSDGSEEEEDEDFEESYLSDLIGHDDDEAEDFDEMSEEDYFEFVDNLSDEELDRLLENSEMFEAKFIKLTPLGTRKTARRKRKKWLKTAAGQAYARKQMQKRKRPAFKKQAKKQRIRRKRAGGARKGYMMRAGVENPSEGKEAIHEDLMESLTDLAESIEREPVSRFDEYVTAFNALADLGELGAAKIMDEDEDAAMDVLNLSLQAEEVLKLMEDMGGALDEDEDEVLEEALAQLMELAGELVEEYGLLLEDEDEEEYEDEELEEDEEEINPFLEAAASLREARRPPKGKKRFLLNPKSRKAVKGRSKWSKAGGNAKRQLAGRKDVRNKQALLGYLKMVKAGKVAPGQPIMMSKTGKPLSKGARAAKKLAAARRKAG